MNTSHTSVKFLRLLPALGGDGKISLDPKSLQHIQSFADGKPISILDRQLPLCKHYRDALDAAWVHNHARTVDIQVPAYHPAHAHVVCGEGIPLNIPVSVHKAVGGESDFSCPGELLAAALASCLGTGIRMIVT